MVEGLIFGVLVVAFVCFCWALGNAFIFVGRQLMEALGESIVEAQKPGGSSYNKLFERCAVLETDLQKERAENIVLHNENFELEERIKELEENQ